MIASFARGANELIVHEWGTFTALQDEDGNAIAGINTDDEPVPKFVHNLADGLLIPLTEAPPIFFQGAPSCHPDVTMRLETPVIYFHCAKDFRGTVDVNVQFRGGWLTQYFPDAAAMAPGISRNKFGALTEKTIGSLNWNKLKLHADGKTPATDAHVWITPRRVDSAMLKGRNGESEKFLFYRGVAHIDAPVRVVRSDQELLIKRTSGELNQMRVLWLADIRPDGKAAVRRVDASAKGLTRIPGDFNSEYSAAAIDALKLEMRETLVTAGLFADEANALLETWSLSYFKSAGLRLFFLVPRSWTDSHLPLTILPEANVTRVMVGRIEIVTPAERALLAKIAAGPAPDSQMLGVGKAEDLNALCSGSKTFASIGVDVPELYRSYLDLGRFRNALLLDEQKHRPTRELTQFIRNFHLEGYRY